MRLLDADGRLVDEVVFTADSSAGTRAVTLASAEGFQTVEITAGAYDGASFIFGAYDDGGTVQAAYTDIGGKLHGSDFLLDELEFHFQPAQVLGVALGFCDEQVGL